jgi:hypothetical protein
VPRRVKARLTITAPARRRAAVRVRVRRDVMAASFLYGVQILYAVQTLNDVQ